MHSTRRSADQVFHLMESALSSLETDRSELEHGERLAAVARAGKLVARLQALHRVLVQEAEAAQSSMAAAGTPMTSWLAMVEGLDTRDAGAEIFRARRLAANPAVQAAALRGLVSAGKADAIARGMETLPAGLSAEQNNRAQEVFLAHAASTTPRGLATLGPRVLAEVAPELVPSPEDRAGQLDAQRKRAVAKRCFNWGDDGDGSTWFQGSLPELEAAPLVAALQAYVEVDRRATSEQRAGMRGLRPRVLRDHTTGTTKTPARRRADALVQLINDHRGVPSVAGDRPRVVVVMQEASLRKRAEQAGVLPSGAEVPAGELRRLCCDAELMPVVLGAASETLDVGRSSRLVTPALRRALSLRDRGCIFPNCHQPDARCEAHHVVPWWAGGETALSNLVLLCPHHHAVVEPDRFRPTADQWRIEWDPHAGNPSVVPPGRVTHALVRRRC